MYISIQGGDTPIDTVVRAATGLIGESILTLYTKEGVESLRILPYTIGGQAVNG